MTGVRMAGIFHDMSVRANFIKTSARSVLLLTVLFLFCVLSGCKRASQSDAVILRVSNWEEYIDEGGWDEAIDILSEKLGFFK